MTAVFLTLAVLAQGGGGVPRWPMKYSIAVLCGDLKATFVTGLVCAAVQQGKTMYCELWL